MTALALAGQAATVLLALVFLRAAWHKVSDLPRAAATAAAYDILPAAQTTLVVRLLTGLELAVALGLILPATRPFAALAAGCLLLAYAAAMAWVLAHGRDRVDCGCGGAPQMISPALIARNLGLTALAALVLVPAQTGGAIEAGVALLAGLTAWALLGTAETLGANHRFALPTEKGK